MDMVTYLSLEHDRPGNLLRSMVLSQVVHNFQERTELYTRQLYSDISILNALCKLYDGILNKRFILWFKPDIEQAGAQEGRWCIEQLLTLCLLIDYARKTKKCSVNIPETWEKDTLISI